MPLMDGVRFLDELRKRSDQGDFGVLTMSATVHTQWVDHVPGVFRTLRKPFEVQELIAAAEDFFSGPPPRPPRPPRPPPSSRRRRVGPETKAEGPKED